MRLNTVDLPDPMPPTRATVSPSAIENDRPVENGLPRRVTEGHVLEHEVAVHVAERDGVRAVP